MVLKVSQSNHTNNVDRKAIPKTLAKDEGSFYKNIFSSSKSHFTFLMKFDIDSKTCKYRQQLLLFIRFAGGFCAIISVNSNFKATFGPKITE